MSYLTGKYHFDRNAKTLCPYQNDCSGCQLLHLPYGEQTDIKKEQLIKLLKENGLKPLKPPEVLSVEPSHLRDRLDFSLENGRLGLYHKEIHEILDLPICTQLSSPLQEWLTEFRNIQWPFKKGSVRLRVGPQGQKGVWLDFANVDIKALLEEQSILKKLLTVSTVEVGQRRKVPFWTGQEFKLRDPELNIWFQTWMKEKPVDLYSHVASFTQPSLRANQLICDVLSSWIQTLSGGRIIEFGSGIGNLTLPALAVCESLTACEIDELSLQGLQKTLSALPPELQNLRSKIHIHRGDFQKKLSQDFSQFDAVLANPPRSGLMSFLTPLENLQVEERPPYFIYMSCFPESMIQDWKRLQDCGYMVQDIYVIDQFPQTKHYEVMGLLQRKQPKT